MCGSRWSLSVKHRRQVHRRTTGTDSDNTPTPFILYLVVEAGLPLPRQLATTRRPLYRFKSAHLVAAPGFSLFSSTPDAPTCRANLFHCLCCLCAKCGPPARLDIYRNEPWNYDRAKGMTRWLDVVVHTRSLPDRFLAGQGSCHPNLHR